MKTVKEGLQSWLQDLKTEKQNAEERLKQAKLNFDLTQVKFNIATAAKERLPHKQEVQDEFYELHVKQLEQSYDSFISSYEETRKGVYREIQYLETLIRRVEESIPEFE